MDIRERGHFAAVAIPAQSYGEIDRRKSSRRRERNYVFVHACLSRDEIREEEEETALETRAEEKERTPRGVPRRQNSEQLQYHGNARPTSSSSPFVRVLSLHVTTSRAMTIRNSIVRAMKLLAVLFSQLPDIVIRTQGRTRESRKTRF